MMSEKIPWADIHKLMQEQYAHISRRNLFYDTELRNDVITMEATRLLQAMVHYRNHIIDQPRFLIKLYKYFTVLRDETEKARIEWLSQHVTVHHPDPFTIDCVKIPTRELDYINERWRSWAYRDGESGYVVELDNNVDEYFADLPMPSRKISDPMYKMPWGKHEGFTIGAIMSFAPRYLIWAHNNTDRFKLSEQLLRDVQGAVNKDRAQDEL